MRQPTRGLSWPAQTGIPVEAEVYRGLLRDILEEINTGSHDHPKLRVAICDAVSAADRGEKTLIFCSRIATLEQLRREFDSEWEKRVLERWRRIYPGAARTSKYSTRGRETTHGSEGVTLSSRPAFIGRRTHCFSRSRKFHCRTVVPAAAWAIERLPDIVRDANQLLKTVRVGKTAAEKMDYQVAKRCVEQVAAVLWSADGRRPSNDPQALRNICADEYIRRGLDLKEDNHDIESTGDEQPRWEISERTARMVLGDGDSLWESLAGLLNTLAIPMRVRLVEQLARYLTYKQIPFLADLLTEAQLAGLSVESVESAALLEFIAEILADDPGANVDDPVTHILGILCSARPATARGDIGRPNQDRRLRTAHGRR